MGNRCRSESNKASQAPAPRKPVLGVSYRLLLLTVVRVVSRRFAGFRVRSLFPHQSVCPSVCPFLNPRAATVCTIVAHSLYVPEYTSVRTFRMTMMCHASLCKRFHAHLGHSLTSASIAHACFHTSLHCVHRSQSPCPAFPALSITPGRGPRTGAPGLGCLPAHCLSTRDLSVIRGARGATGRIILSWSGTVPHEESMPLGGQQGIPSARVLPTCVGRVMQAAARTTSDDVN